MRKIRFLVLGVLAAFSLTCGDDDADDIVDCGPNGECPTGFTCDAVSRRCLRSSSADAGVCVPGAATIALTGPSAYACREPFKAKITLTNQTCAAVTVQDIRITAMVTSGSCAPAGPSTYTPLSASVNRGATDTILDLTGGNFCCTPTVCPATLQCDERFDFVVSTSAGMLTTLTTAHLNLDGCDVVCAAP